MKKIKQKDIRQLIPIISCIVLFGFIGIFVYSKTCFISQGVKIEASVSKADENSALFLIEGYAERAINFTLNGREIFIDTNGYFKEIIDPLPGYSIVKLEAKDKFGNHTEKSFKLVEKEITDSLVLNPNEEKIIN